jgi:hypothetical protein
VDAEDVAAETMVRALGSWSSMRTYRSPWVKRVATNLAIDVVRRRNLDRGGQPAIWADVDSTDRIMVQAALAKLPERQRQARDQWLGDGLDAGGADQNIAVPIAIADLRSGEQTDTGSTGGYAGAIASLQNYASLPDAMLTPAQSADATANVSQLNTFFGVTSAEDDCQLGAGTPAASAWGTEPTGTSAGVDVAGLQQSGAALEQQTGLDACPAGVDDLKALESASPAQIADSSGSGNVPTIVGDEIAYLNALFQTDVLSSGG